MDFKDIEYGDLTGKTYDGDISVVYDIESLKGAPKIVKGEFSCGYCESLSSLKGAPKTIDGDFYCNGCKNLETLKGAPKIVKGSFICNDCTNLKDLEGSTEIVELEFNCYGCKNLETLKGAPKKCKEFRCFECPKLKNLDPLLKCDIETIEADKHLLENYLKKKKAIEKYGWDKAMKIIDMLNDLI